jgi:hypothetical protein
VISMALLTAVRCIARVATPSETVNDKLFMRLPSSVSRPPSLDFQPAQSLYCHRLLPNARRVIMPPVNRRRKECVHRRCGARTPMLAAE